ncbi:ATP synthase F1 subunit delta [Qiania dongpingensis]|uniref:ATP synthase subunit delta n=1 Tax=Qiania dongpingensis TaxID=2763669 RepID=A0A7G9G1I4_9FIRM|nr:ATP synthase F1 subunit delta [Qiania dongpingensis]QNM04666.1 F0F1 ATP synthase subunit delta [Qiania dongpingensis]
MAKLISKTYGEALFETALDVKNVDGLFAEAEAVREILSDNPKLLKLFNHPNIIKEEKLEVMESVFKGRVSAEMTGFLKVVIEKGRQNELDAILSYFIGEVKEYKKIGIAFVTSAAPLSDEQKEQIEQKLLETTKYEAFEMNFRVDESLIGGLVIRIGDRVVDSSVKSRLYELKKELMKIQLG